MSCWEDAERFGGRFANGEVGMEGRWLRGRAKFLRSRLRIIWRFIINWGNSDGKWIGEGGSKAKWKKFCGFCKTNALCYNVSMLLFCVFFMVTDLLLRYTTTMLLHH
jgi:hypothetical protein